ncbi:hypothetical protein U1Q18_039408 [Sarracenia purpurea var. burkii]
MIDNMYARCGLNQYRGPLSMTVPGELAGLYMAWKQYGNLTWKRLVDPAEQLAHKGFRIPTSQYVGMVGTKSKGLRGKFAYPHQNMNLANTLREISKHGSEALYNGSIGTKLVNEVQRANGILMEEN